MSMKAKHYLPICLLFWAALLPGRGSLNGDYLNKVELKLVSPHEAWGKPCARGKLKVLFITSLVGAPRDIVELAQRFDMDWAVFTFLGVTFRDKPTIGGDDEYFALVEGTSSEVKTKELLAKLDERPQVIVLGNIDPLKLPAECQSKLFHAVVEGAGLVRISYSAGAALTVPPILFYDLDKKRPDAPAKPTRTPNLVPQRTPQSVLVSLPYCGLRDFALRAGGYRKWTTAKPMPIEQLFAKSISAGKFGEGRTIGFWYEESATDSYLYRSKAALAPAAPDDLTTPIQYDYYLRAVAEAILWAGKRDSRYTVTFGQPEGLMLPRAQTRGYPLSFTVNPGAGAPAAFQVTARLRDEFGVLLEEQAFTGGSLPLIAQLALPYLKAGVHYLELTVASSDGSETWPTQSFRVTDRRSIKTLTVTPRGFPAGQPVQAHISFGAVTGPETALELMVLDAFDRVAAWTTVPVKEGKRELNLAVDYPNPVSVGNTLLVTLKDRSGPLSCAWTNFFAQPIDEYERFPSVILGGGGGGYLDRFLYRNLRRAFFTSILNGTVIDRCDFTSVPAATYLQLTASKDGRTLNWLMGPKILDPVKEDASIYNPAVQRELTRQLQESVDKNADKGVFVYNLGDENGFSYDGGSGPFEVEAFRKFLQERYAGDLSLLNACWATSYHSWSDVQPVPNAEAKRLKRAAPFVDRCLFNDEAYAELYHFAAQALRTRDPGAKTGAEGSQPGDLERTIADLDFWTPYTDRVNRYLQKSTEQKRLISGNWWGGYVGAWARPRDPVEGGKYLWEQLLSGFANSSWWFMTEGVEGLVNPDLSFADYFVTGSLPFLREICDGIGQQINETEFDNPGIYVYYSQPSIHASKVITAFGDTARSVDSALALLEDIGQSPRILTPRQVVNGQLTPARVKLLILPTTLVLSPEEVRQIEQYLKSGGRVIADIAPGILGAHAEILNSGSLDALFNISRARPDSASTKPAQLEINGTRFNGAVLDSSVRNLSGTGQISMIVKQRGKGQAVLLNFSLDSARQSLAPASADAWHSWWREQLSAAGVKSWARLEGTSGRLTRFVAPDLALLGIMQPKRDATGQANLRFLDSPHEVYDVIAGRYLGKTDRISFNPGQRMSRLYALMPVKAPPLTLKLAGCTAGESIAGQVDLAANIPSGQRRVLRVATVDALGHERLDLRRYPRAGSRTVHFTIPTAFNDPAGEWTVTVTDIVTGQRASAQIHVKAAPCCVTIPYPWKTDVGLTPYPEK